MYRLGNNHRLVHNLSVPTLNPTIGGKRSKHNDDFFVEIPFRRLMHHVFALTFIGCHFVFISSRINLPTQSNTNFPETMKTNYKKKYTTIQEEAKKKG